MAEENQAALAEMLADALNESVLGDAVESGLEDEVPFTVNALGVLDALAAAGLKLSRDVHGDASIAYTTLLGVERDLGGPEGK